ncbi:hypothetical protein ABH920_009301 [Catenulispora sp. EB89]
MLERWAAVPGMPDCSTLVLRRLPGPPWCLAAGRLRRLTAGRQCPAYRMPDCLAQVPPDRLAVMAGRSLCLAAWQRCRVIAVPDRLVAVPGRRYARLFGTGIAAVPGPPWCLAARQRCRAIAAPDRWAAVPGLPHARLFGAGTARSLSGSGGSVAVPCLIARRRVPGPPWCLAAWQRCRAIAVLDRRAAVPSCLAQMLRDRLVAGGWSPCSNRWWPRRVVSVLGAGAAAVPAVAPNQPPNSLTPVRAVHRHHHRPRPSAGAVWRARPQQRRARYRQERDR